jgi:uncharacterized phiE125 gp8 family phage protein
MMAMVERAPPAAAIAELKAYLRIEGGEEDALLAGLLRAATETVEAMLGALLFERGVEERGFVRGGVFALTQSPAVGLDSASLVVPGEGERLLSAADVRFDASRFGDGHLSLPGITEGEEIVVRYRAGLAVTWNGVPEILRLSVIRAAAHFHAHRDSADDGGLPPAVARMLSPWRARRLH